MQNLSVSTVRALFARTQTSELPHLIERFSNDDRAGVRSAVGAARRRAALEVAEMARLRTLALREWELGDQGALLVAGVDEVGRGALAGPVSAGACVFARDVMIRGLNDSKRLAANARERLNVLIADQAIAVAVAHAGPDEIDSLGIAAATVLAMRRAVRALCIEVDHVLVDGHPVDLGVPSTSIVKGDSRVRAIAAAAITAKVTRDALMQDLDHQYPGYGFAGNKGYGSADHLEAIAHLGPSPVHRMSFSPCSQRTLF